MNCFLFVALFLITAKCHGNDVYDEAYESIGKDNKKAFTLIYNKANKEFYKTCISVRCQDSKFEKSDFWNGVYIDENARQECYEACRGLNNCFYIVNISLKPFKVNLKQ